MVFLWTVLGLWALIFSMAIPSSFGEGFRVGLANMAVAWTPLALLIWFVIQRAATRQKAHAAMLADAGVAAGSGSDHAEEGTGIAVNKAAMTVTLLVGGFHKTYPFGSIREWETKRERAGKVVGVGLHAGIAAVGENARAEREAKANTGLFVTVKDVDHPKWRIAMRDEHAQARWMEILRQAINES